MEAVLKDSTVKRVRAVDPKEPLQNPDNDAGLKGVERA
jgi:hypothetical protein